MTGENKQDLGTQRQPASLRQAVAQTRQVSVKILAEWLQEVLLRSDRPCRDDYDAGVVDECGRTVLKLRSILDAINETRQEGRSLTS